MSGLLQESGPLYFIAMESIEFTKVPAFIFLPGGGDGQKIPRVPKCQPIRSAPGLLTLGHGVIAICSFLSPDNAN